MPSDDTRPLENLRVLVVEDELMVALGVQSELEDAGAIVLGPSVTTDDAVTLIESDSPDLAVLDVDLRGAPTFDVAHALEAKAIPFLWYTGDVYNTVFREKYPSVPVKQKPSRLVAVLQELQARRQSGA